MSYIILISSTAEKDLQAAIDYYNEKAENLGYRFGDMIEDYFNRIALVPKASAIRYRNVRCKPMITFPYLIMYTIDEDASAVNILRIFNTWQEPPW